MLGSAVALGGRGWRTTLLADISPNVPSSDILPISLSNFPGLLSGETPSIQLRLSALDEIIMINRPPYNPDVIYVLDARCTHQGCPVYKWESGLGIVCPCHGSTYDVDGRLTYGVAGPFQGSLRSYDFTFDGVDLLQIHVPDLNLKINGITAETITSDNKRLRLSFPGRYGCDYRVLYSPDLETVSNPVLFSTTATGQADTESVRCLSTDPLNVWVDNFESQGFYRIELLLTEVY